MIRYEKQIVKKIPFYLQIQEYEQALRIAVKGGDPNNINKVFTEILKRELDSGEAVITYASKVEGGLRHLRNYAKKRGVAGQHLLKQIYQFQKESERSDRENPMFGLKALGQDSTEIEHYISKAYQEKDFLNRQAFLQKAEESLQNTYQDAFLIQNMKEVKEVTNKQIEYFKKTNAEENLVDQSLGDLV